MAALSTAEVVGEDDASASDLATLEADLERDVAHTQALLAQSIVVGGIKNDPLSKVLEAVSASLGVQQRLHAANARHFRDVARELEQRLSGAVEQSRQFIDPQAISRVEKAAAAGAARYGGDLARAQVRRTAMLAGAILAGSVLTTAALFGFGGYWWGHSSAVAQVQETEGGLAAAFRDGPDAAAGWVNLMRLNDLPKVLASCTGDRGFTDPSGRRACNAPLWIDAGRATPPPKGH